VWQSRYHNAGKNHDAKIWNRAFENVSQFKYLGTRVTNQNSILEDIKKRLNSGNACYQSVQSILSTRLSKSLKIWKNYNFACYIVWVWN
jgi:hypothetical protein